MLDLLLTRAQAAGAVRGDVRGRRLLIMLKGVCEVATALAHVDREIVERHLDLVRSALTASATTHPLHGRSPTLEDIERAFPHAATRPSVAKPATG